MTDTKSDRVLPASGGASGVGYDDGLEAAALEAAAQGLLDTHQVMAGTKFKNLFPEDKKLYLHKARAVVSAYLRALPASGGASGVGYDDGLEAAAKFIEDHARGKLLDELALGSVRGYLAKDIRALKGQPAPGASGVDGWLPIESAPSGKSILLWGATDIDDDGSIRNWKMATGHRATTPPTDDTFTDWSWDGRRLKVYDTQPTHWRPLPPAPGAGAAPVQGMVERAERVAEEFFARELGSTVSKGIWAKGIVKDFAAANLLAPAPVEEDSETSSGNVTR